MPKTRAPFDANRYQTLKAQGLPQRQIAKELGIPESTLRDNLRLMSPALTPESGPQVDEGGPKGIPRVDNGTHTGTPQVDVGRPSEVSNVHAGGPDVHFSPQDLADLQALLAWWRTRQALAADADTPERQLERQTYHIEKRWIEAVRRESDLTGESYAAIVNRAFARYFVPTST